jgi:hypothetical protein
MTLSPRGAQLQRPLALTLQLLAEHDKAAPAEVEALFAMWAAHVHSTRLQALLTGGAP